MSKVEGSSQLRSPHTRAELLDEASDRYLDWRAQCLEVWKAYERWANCPPADRKLAFEAYKAALDLEEHASHVYSDRLRSAA